MSSASHYPHLTTADDGSVRIGTGRYKVRHLAVEHYHHGWCTEELLRQHPDLRPEEVYAALAYFYDHFEVMVADIKELALEAESVRPPVRFSREELLQRLATPET